MMLVLCFAVGCSNNGAEPTMADGGTLDTLADSGPMVDSGFDINVDSEFDINADGGADGTADLAKDGEAGCSTPIKPSAGVVVTRFGAVAGVDRGASYAYLGIPFAKPPVGARRWQPPQPPICWQDLRAANAYPPECPQMKSQMTGGKPSYSGQEDCLYLNVFVPKAQPSKPRAVMVYIHGGGNQQGSTSLQRGGVVFYDGQSIAEKGDVVVVTVQYRVGPLGFLALPQLAAKTAYKGSGNYGLLDQIQALKWVRDNIERFGGDPKKVTIFGESGGAVDVCMLIASPLAKGLFGQAIMQSGACVAATRAAGEKEGLEFLAEQGCDTDPDPLTCLHQKTPEQLVANLSSPFSGGLVDMGMQPTVDGWVLPKLPLAIISAAEHNKVPFIVGSNRDETAITVPKDSITPTAAASLFFVIDKDYRAPLLALYPPGTTNSEATESFIRATTDVQFICMARRAARAMADNQTAPVYRYQFSHEITWLPTLSFGAFHGLELFYLFGGLERSQLYSGLMTADDKSVVDTLIGRWTHFAKTASPNPPGTLRWPVYDSKTDPYLDIGGTTSVGHALRAKYCDTWDATPPPAKK
jgi:para-nitrobenzyl esterase